jgi:hypothetical protein
MNDPCISLNAHHKIEYRKFVFRRKQKIPIPLTQQFRDLNNFNSGELLIMQMYEKSLVKCK